MCALLGDHISEEWETLSPGERLSRSNHMPAVLSAIIMEYSQDWGLKQAWKAKLAVLLATVPVWPADGLGTSTSSGPLCGALLGETDVWWLELGQLLHLEDLGSAGGNCTRCFAVLTPFLILYWMYPDYEINSWYKQLTVQMRISCTFLMYWPTQAHHVPLMILTVIIYLQNLGHVQ